MFSTRKRAIVIDTERDYPGCLQGKGSAAATANIAVNERTLVTLMIVARSECLLPFDSNEKN